MKIKYVNHAGAEFVLHGDDLSFIDPMDLFSWEWSYALSNNVDGLGGRASGFARRPRTFSLELRMRGYSREQFLKRMNQFLAVADADNIAGQPGRLYADEQYMICYLAVAGAKPTHPRLSNFATRSVTVLAVEPYWRTDVSFNVFPGSSGEGAGTDGKKYNYKYGYRYSTGLSGNTIINTHYAPTPAVITVFGPASNPSVSIGGKVYAVNVIVTATDRLVIDQVNNTITIISATGAKTNVFNARDKAHDIFAPVEVGENAIVYSGEYALNITLVQQRSELVWKE